MHRSRGLNVLLAVLLTLAVAVGPVAVAGVLAAATAGEGALWWLAGLGAWIVANLLLVPRAYPPGARPWLTYVLFTVLLAVVATSVLAWYAVTKTKWRDAGVEPRARSGLKVCPDCAETVREEANVCRYCGCRFVPVESG